MAVGQQFDQNAAVMALDIRPDFILELKQSKKEYKNNKNKPRGNASFYCIPNTTLQNKLCSPSKQV
jgi:hypothetical protein